MRSPEQMLMNSRFVMMLREARWVLYLIAGLSLAVMLFTWHATDPGWVSTSGSGEIQNAFGAFGAYFSSILLYLFGFSAWWFVLLCLQRLYVGYKTLMSRFAKNLDPEVVLPSLKWKVPVGFIMLLLGSIGLESTQLQNVGQQLPGQAGGVLGQLFSGLLERYIGVAPTMFLMAGMVFLGFSLFFNFSWLTITERIGSAIAGVFVSFDKFRSERADRRIGETAQEEMAEQITAHKEQLPPSDRPLKIEPAIKAFPVSEKAVAAKQVKLFEAEPKVVRKGGTKIVLSGDIPGLELLDPAAEYVEPVGEDTIEYNSRLIEKKLSDFNVQVEVVAAQAGPVITRYEIEPASGVKGIQIVNLSKDLARALSLIRLRVVENIPGKNLMGIELPNPRRQVVRLSEIIGSQAYEKSNSLLTVALGKDIAGNPVVADLAKMPHLLVAGTTGSGKSVGINAMILSLLYKADPSQVRLILIDPKMLEMSVYEGIGHLLAPVVTDMRHAANALNWCVGEMEKRYKLMSKMGVRNIAGFNSKIKEAEARGETIDNPFSLTPDSPEPLKTLPMIVVVIDELADLMMVQGKKIEELIARLAQKARAAGIHLILATQRPSVDVITGLIKANIPTRIAFQVSSKIDSRTILDQMGAESLLGMGDMLYMPPGSGFPQRVHGAFVSDDEVHRVVDYLKEQGEPDYVDGVLEGGSPGETGDGLGSVTGFADAEADPLYDQAVDIVLKTRRASISSVQRQLRIGYNRAARLLEQMEHAGIVSPMGSNNSREIIAPANTGVDEEDVEV
ncbi:MAG: DNA translocase FtsK [Alcaligenaceae bacterium]|nr:DNA translocase FtsK [Alcaligenaceae bacterium]HZJ96555.1 DNA translocase FtsK 4TM domain-containing protein [Oligella sp.]